ncbi:caspase family protein [Bradyrhizobium sp. CW4]|nr:caspase family protein [Bradyrhizobium sp. CW4]
MTVPRILVGIAVLLGLFSTGLDRTMRLETPRSMSARIGSGESAPVGTNRLALVIGNSTYPDADSPLSQMTRDAEGLTNALRNDGFLVDAVDNAARPDITRAIDRLTAKVHLNSIVLVYFGGYGVQSDGQNYLIPVDAKIWTEEDVRRQGVSIDRLLSQLKSSGARVRLVVIEASRRNPYERRFRNYSHGLAPIQTSENALILSSAAPGQVVEDVDELHSQLMTALLERIGSSKGIEEVFNNTRNAVVAATQGQQIPAVSSTLTENIDLSPIRDGALPCALSAPQLAAAASHQTEFC